MTDQPSDPLRIGDGVAFKDIQVDQALPVCEQAAERQPARPRYQYLYGRVLDAAKRYPDAAAQLRRGGPGWVRPRVLRLGRDVYAMAQGVPKDWNRPCAFISARATPALPMPLTKVGELYVEENPPDYHRSEVLVRTRRAGRLG